MHQALTAQPDVPLSSFARALWEASQPMKVLGGVLRIGDRALLKRLSSGIDGKVPMETVNLITSYTEEFAVPLDQDHPQVVVLARLAIRSTTDCREVQLILENLTAALTAARASRDLRLQGLLHWQMVGASLKAANLTQSRKEIRKYHEAAAQHAVAMGEFVRTAHWSDPNLMCAIERRNWASTDYLLRTLETDALDEGTLLGYIKAYDEGIAALNAAHMGVHERPGADVEPERQAKRRPMMRSFVLDRLDISGQFKDKLQLTEEHIRAVEREAEFTSSPNLLWMALLSLEEKTKRGLQRYPSWIDFQKKLKQAVNERRSSSR